jgi:rhodanese-related sulfurtransferase
MSIISLQKNLRKFFMRTLTSATLAGPASCLGLGSLVFFPIQGFAEGFTAPEVSLDELKKLVSEKSVVLVDANGTSTYKEGHIPGAIDFEKNEGDLAKVLPKDKKSLIVAYCGGPLCVAWEGAAKKITAMGYTNVKHFKGGIKGWKDSGQPVGKG